MSGVFKQGARFAITRLTMSDEAVVYEAVIELPEGHGFSRTIRVGRADGAVDAGPLETVGHTTGRPDPWMSAFVERLVDQLVRSSLKSGDWPRKLRRWKGSPE